MGRGGGIDPEGLRRGDKSVKIFRLGKKLYTDEGGGHFLVGKSGSGKRRKEKGSNGKELSVGGTL